MTFGYRENWFILFQCLPKAACQKAKINILCFCVRHEARCEAEFLSFLYYFPQTAQPEVFYFCYTTAVGFIYSAYSIFRF